MESTVETSDGQAISGTSGGGGVGSTGAPQFLYPLQAFKLNNFYLLLPNVTVAGTGLQFQMLTSASSLPTGLLFNSITGMIYGIPTAYSSTKSFTIKATNSAGSKEVSVVIDAAPDFEYDETSFNYKVGEAFSEIPDISYASSGLTFTIDKTLPKGLKLCKSATETSDCGGTITPGRIWGTPEKHVGEQESEFIITASANGHETTFNLSLIDISSPEFKYPDTSDIEYKLTEAIEPIIPEIIHGNIDDMEFTKKTGELATGLTLCESDGDASCEDDDGNTYDPGTIWGTPTAHVSTLMDVLSTGKHETVIQAASSNSEAAGEDTIDFKDISPPEIDYETAIYFYRGDPEGLRESGIFNTAGGVEPEVTFCSDCVFEVDSTIPSIVVDPNGKITSAPITNQILDPDDKFTLTVQSGANQVEFDFTIEERCNDSANSIASQKFGGGAGTISDPWLLCTVGHLNEISTVASNMSEYYKLSDDINFTSDDVPFTPIKGPSGQCFAGDFDGNNKVISNLQIYGDNTTLPFTGNAGFFDCIENFHTIRNLTFLNTNIYAEDFFTGTLAGYARMDSNLHTKENKITGVNAFRTYLNQADGVVGGLIGNAHCLDQSGSSILEVVTNIFHGEINHNESTAIKNKMAGLFNTPNIASYNCISADKNLIFLKDMDGVVGNFIFNNSATPPLYDVNDMATAGAQNSKVTNNIIVDEDSSTEDFKHGSLDYYFARRTLFPDPSGPQDTIGYNKSHQPALQSPETWQSFIDASTGYTSSVTLDSEIRWVVPEHLCDKDATHVVKSAIPAAIWSFGGGGLKCQ